MTQSRQKLAHFNLQKMYGYLCKEDSDLCSEMWTISIYNEFLEYDLE